MPPQGPDTRTGAPRLTPRERWLVRSVVVAAVTLLVAVVVSLAASGPRSSRGCIRATIPAATGAQQISECGPTARFTCATVHTPGAYTPQAAQTIALECRRAGLRVGS